jgi:hypothetical protein
VVHVIVAVMMMMTMMMMVTMHLRNHRGGYRRSGFYGCPERLTREADRESGGGQERRREPFRRSTKKRL